MFKFIEIKMNIDRLVCDHKNIFIVEKNNTISLNEKVIFESLKSTDARFCINNYYTYGDSETRYLGNFKNNKEIIFEYNFSSNCIWKNFIVNIKNYRYDEKDGKVKGSYFLLNYDTSEEKLLLKDVEESIVLIYNLNKNGICRFGNILSSLYLLTGDFKWELDLQNELSLQNEIKIQQLFDVCDNLLWVWLTNYQLVGIDVDSSRIIHNYFPLHNLMQTGLVYVNHLKYNKQENCIYFFEQGYFIQIQLATQQTQLLWHNAEYDTGSSVIHDDYVYFVGGKRQSFFKNQIGVFDRKLNDVIWQTQIKINGYESIQQIEVASNKIYVRTTEGNLHIFEKEKVVNLKESSE